jgi:C4-dicarboxylate transporter, DctM subunit
MYILAVQLVGIFRPELLPPGGKRASWPEKIASLRDVWATVLLFVFCMGGMYGGLFTATEAGGMGAGGAFLIGLARGRLGLKNTMECLVNAIRTTAAIFTIVIGAFLFGYFLVITQAAQNFSAFLLSLPLGPYGILALIILMYILLGAVMDELAMVLLTVPIIFPVVTQLGFDPIWFGVIIVMVVCLGMIMPPIGMNVFVINSLARDVSLMAIYRGVTPFILMDLVRLALLVTFPWLSLFLPAQMK